MNEVSFPGFNLILNVSRYAFQVAGVNIYNYAVCIVLGVITALVFARISKNKLEIEFDDILENMIYALIFGVIGARLYYVLFNLNQYISNPLEILNFRDGGLAIYGGLILGSISLCISLKIKKTNILDFFDRIVPYVAIAQSIGRWGNFFNIEAYGIETSSIFRMGILKNGIYSEVHPMFLYESVLNLILFFILIKMQSKRKFKGQVLLGYLIGYSMFRMILESFRIDSLMIFNYRVSQILSIIIFIITIMIYFVLNRKNSAKADN